MVTTTKLLVIYHSGYIGVRVERCNMKKVLRQCLVILAEPVFCENLEEVPSGP